MKLTSRKCLTSVLALVLALIMGLGTLSLPVFAEGEKIEKINVIVSYDGEGTEEGINIFSTKLSDKEITLDYKKSIDAEDRSSALSGPWGETFKDALKGIIKKAQKFQNLDLNTDINTMTVTMAVLALAPDSEVDSYFKITEEQGKKLSIPDDDRVNATLREYFGSDDITSATLKDKISVEKVTEDTKPVLNLIIKLEKKSEGNANNPAPGPDNNADNEAPGADNNADNPVNPAPPANPAAPATPSAPADTYTEFNPVELINEEVTPLGGLDKDKTPLDALTEDSKAYITGYNDGTIQPETTVTREVAATILYRLTDPKNLELKTEEVKFSDVKESDWSYQYIETMVKAGIFKGYVDGSFRPSAPITRAELASVLSKFFNIEEATEHKFEDIKAHWAEKFIAGLAAKGYASGYPDGSFQPGKELTRAELASIINKILMRNVKKEELPAKLNQFKDLAEDKWYYTDLILASTSYKAARGEDGVQKFIEAIETSK